MVVKGLTAVSRRDALAGDGEEEGKDCGTRAPVAFYVCRRRLSALSRGR